MAVINGTNGPDFLEGTANNDVIRGFRRRDILLGLEGNDTLKGGGGQDILNGGAGNDDLFGQGGRDNLRGSAGDDLLDGGNGIDTANYSNLGQAITLEAVGVINKGSLGVDQILDIETIIGATGQANSIDGATGTSSTTSFEINLGGETLTVQGIPGLGNADFTIRNFVNATGTSRNDSIVGSSDDNILQGGAGADFFGGSEGDDTIAGNNLAGDNDNRTDTIDYSGLGTGITLTPTGIIEKGALGTDTLIRVETIIAEAGQDNIIDAADTVDVALNLDLNAETLEVDINGGPILERTVVNFVDVIGTAGADNIADNSLNNALEGGRGRDTIESSAGNDTISGGRGNDTIIA
ncbi:MAG TPA: calcium-binding protein, partial [Xenococcaceae cyanobacterium]